MSDRTGSRTTIGMLRRLRLLAETSLGRGSGLLLTLPMVAMLGRCPGLLLVPVLLTGVECCLGL